MSEVNSIILNVEASKSLKDTMNFNKKNAWKNEWEKAQLETKNENNSYNKAQMQQSKPIESFGVGEVSKSNDTIINKGELLDVRKTDAAATYIKGEIESKITYSSVVLKVNSLNSSGNQFNKVAQNISDNIKPSVLRTLSQNNYTQAVIDKSEVKFGSKYKLQNLNILVSESGAKMVLRDYRLEKSQLTEIVDEITVYLNEFGVDINEVIVNGVRYAEK